MAGVVLAPSADEARGGVCAHLVGEAADATQFPLQGAPDQRHHAHGVARLLACVHASGSRVGWCSETPSPPLAERRACRQGYPAMMPYIAEGHLVARCARGWLGPLLATRVIWYSFTGDRPMAYGIRAIESFRRHSAPFAFRDSEFQQYNGGSAPRTVHVLFQSASS